MNNSETKSGGKKKNIARNKISKRLKGVINIIV